MKKYIVITLIFAVAMLSSSCHEHEHSEVMKEVIEMNKSLWEDLNATKDRVKKQIAQTEASYAEPDMEDKGSLEAKLIALKAQKAELAQLDQEIPELKGYEPKCNHEPGEPHKHNTTDVSGIPETELLELHKELRKKLGAVKAKMK